MEIDFINNNYSEEFIKTHVKSDHFDYHQWYYISAYQVLSENFIREFKYKVSWVYISQHQILSEQFIREFQDEVDWRYIPIYQILSESFIREYKDYVNWYSICEFQKLSIEFIDEMIQECVIKEVHIQDLLKNKKINQEELKNYLSI